MEEVKIAELFAGVGGFKIGLENASKLFKVVWSNQWEPATKSQEASEIYIKRFGKEGHSNIDIAKVSVEEIPEHNLLVGGFPCQDYSVAKSLSRSHGIVGKKGVLWWEIHRILRDMKKTPEFVLLENVDRLLSSPANQRGRDFAIILKTLSDLGYIVEWRVITASEYGMPQRRKRVFILGYHKSTNIFKNIKMISPSKWVFDKGVLAKAFKVKKDKILFQNNFKLDENIVDLSRNFNKGGRFTPFQNSGIIVNGEVYTAKVFPDYNGNQITLKDIILNEKEVPEEFFINGDFERWAYLKGAKKEQRTNKATGKTYFYSEGSMSFPDSLDSPSRTIITGEGGSSPSRFKHVIKTKSGRFRRLTPLELERLNMFPDNHTEGCSNVKRAFLMGNALVVGVIECIGKSLASKIKELN